jgi:hypothetical protein
MKVTNRRALVLRFLLTIPVALLIFTMLSYIGAAGSCGDQGWSTPACNGGGGGGGGNPTTTPTPAPPAVTAGLGFGSWTGSPAPNSVYQYGNIDASTGGGACPDPQNPAWPAGPNAWVADKQSKFNAFWFLRSLEWAAAYCGAPYASDSAQQWGTDQAQMFQSAINNLPNSEGPLYLYTLFADIEWLNLTDPATGQPCDPSTNATKCSGPLNAGYWYQDTLHQAENVQVINAFMTALCGTYHECNTGVYTSSFNWPEITGGLNGAPPSAIDGAAQIWIASWNVSQSQLNQQEQEFTNQPYVIYSWQYNVQTSSGCQFPSFTLSVARSEASSAAPPIPRLDPWTNSAVDKVC